MEFIIFYVFFAILPASIATKKGRSGFEFFLIGLLLTPIIGIISALLAKPNIKKIEEEQIKLGLSRRCSNCAEVVKRRARVCKHCRNELVDFEDISKSTEFILNKKSILIGGALNLFFPGFAQLYCKQYLWGITLFICYLAFFIRFLQFLILGIEADPDAIVKSAMIVLTFMIMTISLIYGIFCVRRYNKNLINELSEDLSNNKNQLNHNFAVTDE